MVEGPEECGSVRIVQKQSPSRHPLPAIREQEEEIEQMKLQAEMRGIEGVRARERSGLEGRYSGRKGTHGGKGEPREEGRERSCREERLGRSWGRGKMV